MSKDYAALGIPAISTNSFNYLPSKKHLKNVLNMHKDLSNFNIHCFEWLNEDNSKTLHKLLTKHFGANMNFKPTEKGTTIKLNIIEWLHVYNLFIQLNNQSKLDSTEKNLMLCFIDRFECLVHENPLSNADIKSFPRTKGQDGYIFKVAEIGFKTLLLLSGFLVLANMYLNLKAITIITFFTTTLSCLFILYKEKIKKLTLPELNLTEMYTQMLIDNSY